MMRRLTTLATACALAVALAACGSSDTDIAAQAAAQGTGNAGAPVNNAQVNPVPTPTPAMQTVPQDTAGNDLMTARELAFASEVFTLVNTYRTNNALAALTWNVDVARVAQQHTQSMRLANTLTHSSLPATSTAAPFNTPPSVMFSACTSPPTVCPAVRLTESGVAWVRATENVGQGQRTPQEILTDWQNSPGHNANLLDPDVTDVGIGFQEGGAGPFWTMKAIRP